MSAHRYSRAMDSGRVFCITAGCPREQETVIDIDALDAFTFHDIGTAMLTHESGGGPISVRVEVTEPSRGQPTGPGGCLVLLLLVLLITVPLGLLLDVVLGGK